MAWSGGVFTRTNGFYSGATVWQSDYLASVKIVYSRHDTHDQDLAQGINACLNKNGENSPTASINWGGFKITNMAVGSAASDSARYGQTITGATVNSSTKVLTLARADGDVTVDLTPITVAGDTSDFARYSAASNAFSAGATFGGTLGCDFSIQMLDQLTATGDYTWGLNAITSSRFQIAPASGANNTLDLITTSTTAELQVGGSTVLTEAIFDPDGVLHADEAENISGAWSFTAISIQLPSRVVNSTVEVGSSWAWEWHDSFWTLTPTAVSAPLAYAASSGYTAGAVMTVNNYEVWNRANLSLIAAAPTAGHNEDVAIVTTGPDQGLWVKIAGTWTKIL